jgi:HTH-type transcriptional regulator, global nitrogen regulator NrpRI
MMPQRRTYVDKGEDVDKITFTILSILDKHQGPFLSAQIVSHLISQGMDISDRTARHYLQKLDEKGFTTNSSKRGRMITEKGQKEIRRGFAYNHIGPIIDRINRLSLMADFNPDTGTGKVILNVSHVRKDDVEKALHVLDAIFLSPYALCDRVVLVENGRHLQDIEVPDGLVGIGTVCSITINAIFLKGGIPIRPRVGGIIEIARRKPVRFESFISYEDSCVTPLEVFITNRKTSVLHTLVSGDGSILGSLREIPQDSLFASRVLMQKLMKCGFRNTTLYGYAFSPLLGIPITEGMVGLVEIGGLNACAALCEAGLSVYTNAMASMYEYSDMKPIHSYLHHTITNKAIGAGFLRQGD